MKSAKLPFTAAFVLFFAGSIAINAQTIGKLFTVNSSSDTSDAEPGDRYCADASGQCSLRAAVQEANANASGRDIIIFGLSWPAVINLNGPLTITGTNVSIVGPGARRLTVQRDPAETAPFRIFHIPNSGTNAVIYGLTIKNGLAGTFFPGGGVRIGAGCSVVLTEIAILNNNGGNGGGISNEGNLTITRSLIASNTAGLDGGAIHTSAGSLTTITNSTITENSGPNGGAIWNAGRILLINNTITHNAASNNARSIFSDPAGSVDVLNTIIGSDNTSAATSLSGSFNSRGNNIVTDARTSTGFANGVNNDQVSDNNTIDPMLVNLSDNGGQTDTRALLDGSPAINAGNSCVWNGSCTLPPGRPIRLRWDQRRGYLRGGVFDPVDIGAFEFGSGSGSVSVGFSVIPLLPAPTARYLNSMAVFTNVATNERTYRTINGAGRFRSPILGNDVYVMEIKTKRSPGFAPSLLSFPD